MPLFNGVDLEGWEPLIREQPVGEDPEGMVTVKDGTIHMYENVPEGDTVVPFGVIMTKESYSQFHLSLQYRWVGKKFHPRKDKLRDAGLLYHCYGPKKVWPPSIECQIQEGDTGDLVFIDSSALTWVHPQAHLAVKGQGDAGRLPEFGGVLNEFAEWGYIGRYPENDHMQGWTTVEAIVHGSEYAMHKVNGMVTSRVLDMRQPYGAALTSGPIALQLEAAEIQYRDVKIKVLPGYLKPSEPQLSFNQTLGLKGQNRKVTLTNTGATALAVDPVFLGSHATAFELKGGNVAALAAGESREFEILFVPDFGVGKYDAGVQFGAEDTGCFLQLSALAQPALEGKNEPTLHQVMQVLGATVNVGGQGLSLDTQKDVLGASITARGFQVVDGEKVKITPLARFSPKGEVPYGIYDLATGDKVEVAKLVKSTEAQPDAHQAILPPSTEVKIPAQLPQAFGLYLDGHHFVSYTEPGKSEKAKIKHTARIFQAKTLQGKRLKNAYIVGFEEAKNGDYQDALFLIEGVKPQK